MTNDEKLSMLKTLLVLDGNEEDERLTAYLHASEKEIIAWRYSYATEVPENVPVEYEMTQIHAVIAGFSISGAENQTSHKENGISRDFKYIDMLAYIRAHVIPIVKVV